MKALNNGSGTVLWEKSFDAAVANAVMADIDINSEAEIIVSTSDG